MSRMGGAAEAAAPATRAVAAASAEPRMSRVGMPKICRRSLEDWQLSPARIWRCWRIPPASTVSAAPIACVLGARPTSSTESVLRSGPGELDVVDAVQVLATGGGTVDEARPVEHGQVLGDGLARDGQLLAQRGRRPGALDQQ